MKELIMDIAASLWLKPCSLDELMTRNFAKSKSAYGIHLALCMAKEKGYIYEKGGIFYCYKKTVKDILNKNGYELPTRDKEPESEFKKSYKKYLKNY